MQTFSNIFSFSFALNGCYCCRVSPSVLCGIFQLNESAVIVSRCFVYYIHSLLHVQTEGQCVCALISTSFVSG